MPKILLTLILAFFLPQLAVSATYSLDDGSTEQAETYTYENFIGNTNLKVDAKPDDLIVDIAFGGTVTVWDVDVTKNAGKGLGVDYDSILGDDNSPALEYDESLVFHFSEEVILSGFTITPGDQPSHYFGVTNEDDDSDIGFSVDAVTGFVSFTEGPMSLLSFAITGLVNCTGFFVESLETPSAVPLPAALPLYAAGMGVLGLMGWRKRRKSAA